MSRVREGSAVPPRLDQVGYKRGQKVRCFCLIDNSPDATWYPAVVVGTSRIHGQAGLLVRVRGRIVDSPLHYIE